MGTCANNQVAFLASDGLKCTNLKEILKTVFPCTNGQILQHTSSGYLRCASNSATAPLGTGILGDTTVLYHPNAIDPDRYTICRSNQVVTITDQGVECVNLGTVLHALLSASSCTDGQILRFNGDDRLRCTDYRSGVPGNLTSLGSAIPVTSETTCATHQVATITADGLVCTNLGLLLENTFPSCSYKVMEYDSGGNIVCVDHPTDGDCGNTKNDCDSGDWTDVSDTLSAHWWECRGTHGGSNDTCSAPVSCASCTRASLSSGVVSCVSDSSQDEDGRWTGWSSCSASSCGQTGTRTRSCVGHACGGTYCSGKSSRSCTGYCAPSGYTGTYAPTGYPPSSYTGTYAPTGYPPSSYTGTYAPSGYTGGYTGTYAPSGYTGGYTGTYTPSGYTGGYTGTYAPTGYPPSSYPPSGYPPSGYPPSGYPPSGYTGGYTGTYAPTGYPPSSYPPSGYPPSGYPPSGYPPSSYTGTYAPSGYTGGYTGTYTPSGYTGGYTGTYTPSGYTGGYTGTYAPTGYPPSSYTGTYAPTGYPPSSYTGTYAPSGYPPSSYTGTYAPTGYPPSSYTGTYAPTGYPPSSYTGTYAPTGYPPSSYTGTYAPTGYPPSSYTGTYAPTGYPPSSYPPSSYPPKCKNTCGSNPCRVQGISARCDQVTYADCVHANCNEDSIKCHNRTRCSSNQRCVNGICVTEQTSCSDYTYNNCPSRCSKRKENKTKAKTCGDYRGCKAGGGRNKCTTDYHSRWETYHVEVCSWIDMRVELFRCKQYIKQCKAVVTHTRYRCTD